MKRIALSLIAVFSLLTACKQESEVPQITVTSPTVEYVTDEGGYTEVSFTSNVNWTATTDNEMWPVYPSHGVAGEHTIKVAFPENKTHDNIETELVICPEAGVTGAASVSIIQLQRDGIAVEQPEDVSYHASTVNVKVIANVDYSVSVAPEAADWIEVVSYGPATRGDIETEIVLNIADNFGDARDGIVTVKANSGDAVAEIYVHQIAWEAEFEFEDVPEGGFTVPIAGGTYTFKVKSNTEWQWKDYNDTTQPFLKAEVVKDGNNATVTVTVDANTELSARSPYVKFTIPAMLDADGNATVEKVYFNQAGKLSVLWETALPDAFTSAEKVSIAKLGQYCAICDGANVYVFDDATGAISSDPIAQARGIFNDDAGNLVLAVGGLSCGETTMIMAYPSNATLETQPTLVLSSTMSYYSAGYNGFKARGNVLENGIITAFIASVDGGIPSAGAYWTISSGTASDVAYVEIAGIVPWISTRCAFAPLAASADYGFLYAGYDNDYSLKLYQKDGTSISLGTFGDWASGISSFQTGMWGAKNIAAFNQMAWFPYWSMPSMVYVYDTSDMSEIVSFEVLGSCTDATFAGEPTTDILTCTGADGSLVIYVADASQGVFNKYSVPAE